MGGFVIDIFVEYFIRVVFRNVRSLLAIGWSKQPATVTATIIERKVYGCTVADVSYRYKIDGEPYTGVNRKPFLSNRSAQNYVDQFPFHRDVTVRVKLKSPATSLLRDGENNIRHVTW